MKSAIISTLMGAAMLMQPSVAHPGESAEQHAQDQAVRRAYLNAGKRSLDHCSEKLRARGNDLLMHQRRTAQVEKLRAKRSIEASKPYIRARDADSVLATSHLSNMTGITADTDPATLFSGNSSCVLTPETTQGPYYVSGELIREDMTEDQEGVPLTLNVQVIDVNTCEVVPEVYIEMWHCNSTGVYSGIVASGNGDSSDTANLDKTWLRGIQQTDESGVATIQSIFPGHYTSRATHIHVLTHATNATLLANNTLSGNTATHVGQMFFDQDLITLVETQEPYASNTQELTTNADDTIFSEEAVTVDPVIEYVLLGDDISEGVFGWLAFGMDTTNAMSVTPAATLTENGGVANANSGMGGGGSPPNGTMPSGGMPSGAIPSGSVSSAATSASASKSASVGSTLSTAVSYAVSSAVAAAASSSSSSSSAAGYASNGNGNGKGRSSSVHASAAASSTPGYASSGKGNGKGNGNGNGNGKGRSSSAHASATPKQNQQGQQYQQAASPKSTSSCSS